MTKSPAYQWYPKDILSSARVAELDLKEEGAYRRALDYCWLNGSVPADPTKLAKVIGKGCSAKIAAAIMPLFTISPDDNNKLIHDRLDKERKKQAEYAERQKQNGKRGGRPKRLENQSPEGNDKKGLGFSGETQPITQTEPKKSFAFASASSIPTIVGGEPPHPPSADWPGLNDQQAWVASYMKNFTGDAVLREVLAVEAKRLLEKKPSPPPSYIQTWAINLLQAQSTIAAAPAQGAQQTKSVTTNIKNL